MTPRLINTFESILPGKGKDIKEIGAALGYFFPKELEEEIKGCGDAMGVNIGNFFDFKKILCKKDG